MLSLIVSIISICISIVLFVSSQFKQLYKLGISTGEVFYNDVVTKDGQERTVMYVNVKIVNESQSPATFIGFTITEKEKQEYSSNYGEFIDLPLSIAADNSLSELKTSTLPVVIPPYSSFKGLLAFYHPRLYREGHYLELEMPKRFLVIPFNPTPGLIVFNEDRHGRGREIKFYWRQNPIRSFFDFILRLFYKRTWEIFKLRTKATITQFSTNITHRFRNKK